PVRPRGHSPRVAPLPGASPDSHPRPRGRWSEQGATGVASAEPGHALQPVASSELCGGVSLRAPADRSAQEAAGAAEHRQVDPPPRGVRGAVARSLARLHHVGAVRGEPGAPEGEPELAEYTRCTTPGSGTAGRAGPLRALRTANDGAVYGAQTAGVVHL